MERAMIITGKRKGEVTFVCQQQTEVKHVCLVGSFNNWDPKAKRMRKYKDGSYRARVNLDAGEHQYKFIIDGDWQHDPEAQNQVTNELGSLNSVIRLP